MKTLDITDAILYMRAVAFENTTSEPIRIVGISTALDGDAFVLGPGGVLTHRDAGWYVFPADNAVQGPPPMKGNAP